MNIADFIERSNPEDLDEALEQASPANGSISAKTPQIGPTDPQNSPKSSLNPKTTLIIAILVLTSSASFGIGILAGQGGVENSGGLLVGSVPTTKPASATLSASALDAANPASSSIPAGGEVVGASDTDKYYLPWCAGASSISKANTVWFANEQMAKAAGYTPGPNCPGI